MRDPFVGDIGDYGKYGLLRALAGEDLRLAVVWYKNSEPANKHGRLTQYLDDADNRICDPLVFDELKRLKSEGRRTIKDAERCGFWPSNIQFFDEQVPRDLLSSPERQRWLCGAEERCSGCQLIFLDPDNGIECSSISQGPEAARYALLDEVERFAKIASVVLYQHPERKKGSTHSKQISAWKDRLEQRTGIRPMAVRFRKQQPRFFFILASPSATSIIQARLQDFSESEWVKHRFFDPPDRPGESAEGSSLRKRPPKLPGSGDLGSVKELSRHYLEETLRLFRRQKRLGDGAMAQLSDEEIFRQIDAESNSVAIIVKHMAGNMLSRWIDFLTSDGEKASRNRDQEFTLDAGTTRADVMRWWDEGWASVFGALEPLRPEDLKRTVTIRGEPHSVLQAMNRQVDHYAYHVGQIVFLAKHLKSAGWKSLSIPRGQSQAVNADPERRKYLK